MTEPAVSFDVVVLGGGPAGAAAATVLGGSGVRTLLVDQPEAARFKPGESLPPAAKPILNQLGAWDRLEADGHQPSRGNESAWGDSILRGTHFVRNPNGHGWHLDRLRFDALLRRRARDAGAHINATGARAISRTKDGWDVTCLPSPTGESVRTRWLIDCTGRRAWAARKSGARRICDDQLIAIVSRLTRADDRDAAPDPDSLTLVESARDGWWYTSRLPNGDRIVVYLTDARDASARFARTLQGFAQMLGETRHVRTRIHPRLYRVENAPRIVAADTSRLDRPFGKGWLAAGDAALSFDPLSSQGILTAIDSGMSAAEALLGQLEGDRSAMIGYASRLDAVYAAYMNNRRDYYDQEQRWAERPFWRNRQSRLRRGIARVDVGAAQA